MHSAQLNMPTKGEVMLHLHIPVPTQEAWLLAHQMVEGVVGKLH